MYLVSGLVWLCSGILNLFEDSKFCKIVALVLMGAERTDHARRPAQKAEHYDEMANAHFMTTQAAALPRCCLRCCSFSSGSTYSIQGNRIPPGV